MSLSWDDETTVAVGKVKVVKAEVEREEEMVVVTETNDLETSLEYEGITDVA